MYIYLYTPLYTYISVLFVSLFDEKTKMYIYISCIFSNCNVFENGCLFYIYLSIYLSIYLYIYISIYIYTYMYIFPSV